jgi:hypothetical protein
LACPREFGLQNIRGWTGSQRVQVQKWLFRNYLCTSKGGGQELQHLNMINYECLIQTERKLKGWRHWWLHHGWLLNHQISNKHRRSQADLLCGSDLTLPVQCSDFSGENWLPNMPCHSSLAMLRRATMRCTWIEESVSDRKDLTAGKGRWCFTKHYGTFPNSQRLQRKRILWRSPKLVTRLLCFKGGWKNSVSYLTTTDWTDVHIFLQIKRLITAYRGRCLTIWMKAWHNNNECLASQRAQEAEDGSIRTWSTQRNLT